MSIKLSPFTAIVHDSTVGVPSVLTIFTDAKNMALGPGTLPQ